MFVSAFAKLVALAAMLLANSVATQSVTHQTQAVRAPASDDSCVGVHCAHPSNVRAPGGGDGSGGGTGNANGNGAAPANTGNQPKPVPTP